MSKDITNEQLFEFMTKMYGEMQEGFKEVKNEIEKTKNRVIIIEQGHGKKLDRIEEVSKHEEIILRRIK